MRATTVIAVSNPPRDAVAEFDGPVRPLRLFYLAAVLGGAVLVVVSLAAGASHAPRLTLASIATFGLIGLACGWLLNRIPNSPGRQGNASLLAALWGGFAAAGFAMVANRAIYDHLAGAGWSLLTPFTEEPLKVLGIVVVLLLSARRPTALDGLVVGSFIGLGFEVVENVVQSINNAIATATPGQIDNWASLATDVIHEVVRRVWTGHIVISGVAGFGIGYAMTTAGSARRWRGRIVSTGLVAVALGAHLLWNSHRFGPLYVLGQFGVLALYVWLIRLGRRQFDTPPG